MGRFVIRRILLTIPVLLGVMLIVYFIMSFTPGDPAKLILGERATAEQIAALNQKLGINQPFFIRFGNYVYNAVFRLDLGLSYRTQTPVINDILQKLPNTFRLALLGVFFSSLIGISLGVLSAIKQYSVTDTLSTVTAMFFAAIPNFWLGMSLILFFALQFNLLPSNGLANWQSYIMPTMAISLPYSARVLRLTRSTMLETIRQDYVRTAQAKGVAKRAVIWRHAFRNALLPIITFLGMNFGELMGGAIVTETVFAIPGLGTHIVDAIRMKETPIVMGCTIILAILFCGIMLAVDILYAFVDPRVKAKYMRGKASHEKT